MGERRHRRNAGKPTRPLKFPKKHTPSERDIRKGWKVGSKLKVLTKFKQWYDGKVINVNGDRLRVSYKYRHSTGSQMPSSRELEVKRYDTRSCKPPKFPASPSQPDARKSWKRG